MPLIPPRHSLLTALFRRPDGALFWLIFYGLILLAWAGLFIWVMQTDAGLAGQGATALGAVGQAFGAPFAWAAHGDPAWGTLAGMWALMALAMMMPTLIPYQQTFNDLTVSLAPWPRWAVRMAFFIGYMGVWVGFGLGAAWAQSWLYAWGWLDVVGVATMPWLTFGLLTLAGLYQFSAWKQACLRACQAPFQFFLSHWRDGTAGAFLMGLGHGFICLGCCWALMLLGFVGGTMNLLWMGAATLLMALEKLPSIGRWVSPLIGGGMLALAFAYAFVQLT